MDRALEKFQVTPLIRFVIWDGRTQLWPEKVPRLNNTFSCLAVSVVRGFRRFSVNSETHVLDRPCLSTGSIDPDSLSHSVEPVVNRLLGHDVGRLLRFESENTIRKDVLVYLGANTLFVYFGRSLVNLAANRRSRGGGRATNSAFGARVILALLPS